MIEVQPKVKISVKNLNFYYGDHQALKDNTLDIVEKRVTSFIGPSGCGKSTHIRAYNRMYEIYRGHRATGEVILDGKNILDPSVDATQLRMKIGMVFQQPTPFPMPIYDNVAYGLKLKGALSKVELDGRVEDALRRAALWGEIKDKLNKSATALSGGQQQRLCIARAIAPEPEVILMDEPCSSLDPVATLKIEELIEELKANYTIVIVTHNMQQAARVSDYTGFFYMGELVEFDVTHRIFTKPAQQRTEDYVTGRFG